MPQNKDNRPATAQQKKKFSPTVLLKKQATFRQGALNVTSWWNVKPPQDEHRRYLYNRDALDTGASAEELFQMALKEKQNFRDIVDQDQGTIENFLSEGLVRGFVESVPFRVTILILILINTIIVVLQTDETLAWEYGLYFDIFDEIVLTTFTMEIVLKWFCGFFKFWKDRWNILDLVIVLCLYLGPHLRFLSSGRTLRILRVVRAVRSTRSIGLFSGLHTIISATLSSLPDVFNICMVLLVCLLIFTVMGVSLFGTALPRSFGNIRTALFSMFVCVTQDGWVDYLRDFEQQNTLTYVLGCLFLFMGILVGAFIFANLVIAAICANLESTIEEIKLEDKLEKMEQAYQHPGSLKVDKSIVEVISLSKFKHMVKFNKQAPMEKANIDDVKYHKYENYCMLLYALEENLNEYLFLKDDFNKLFNVVEHLNLAPVSDDEDEDGPATSRTFRKKKKAKPRRRADVINTMIDLHNKGLLNLDDPKGVGFKEQLRKAMKKQQLEDTKKATGQQQEKKHE